MSLPTSRDVDTLGAMLAELLPSDVFVARSEWALWLFSVGAIAVLVAGADQAVSAAVRLARTLGMSTVIIGATVVSLGTTAPETCVSVMAAFAGKPGLALGNGVGSIICNMAMIFGLCCCIRRLPKDRFILQRHGWLQFGAGALLMVTVFALAGLHGGFGGVVIPRWVGVVFCGLLVGYMALSVHWARQHPDEAEREARNHTRGRLRRTVVGEVLRDLLVLALGLGAIIFSADVLVGSVSEICLRHDVPPNVLAVTLIAFGTSLPELVTGVTAIIKGHPELLVGNIVGANILNVLFVVGASAAAAPLRVPVEFFYLHLPVMMIALGLFSLYVTQRGEMFRRWQGLPLVGLFVAYYAAPHSADARRPIQTGRLSAGCPGPRHSPPRACTMPA